MLDKANFYVAPDDDAHLCLEEDPDTGAPVALWIDGVKIPNVAAFTIVKKPGRRLSATLTIEGVVKTPDAMKPRD